MKEKENTSETVPRWKRTTIPWEVVHWEYKWEEKRFRVHI